MSAWSCTRERSFTSTSGTGLSIQCTKPGYLPGASIIASGTEAMSAGNVLLGGVIGLGVDAASGAMNKYPDIVTVAMVPDTASQHVLLRLRNRF